MLWILLLHHFHDELYYSANEYAEEDAKDEAAYQAFLQEYNQEEESCMMKNCTKKSLIMMIAMTTIILLGLEGFMDHISDLVITTIITPIHFGIRTVLTIAE